MHTSLIRDAAASQSISMLNGNGQVRQTVGHPPHLPAHGGNAAPRGGHPLGRHRRPARACRSHDDDERLRERIKQAAVDLFRQHGLRGVSADRIIARANVSKVTFYRHFPTKDDVIFAYLQHEWDAVRAVVENVDKAGKDDGDGVDLLVAMMREQMCAPGFRGCPFINAAAELTDPDHPARALIRDYRAWLTDQFASQLRAADIPDADHKAHHILMLRDGAMVAGYLAADLEAVNAELDSSLRRVIGTP